MQDQAAQTEAVNPNYLNHLVHTAALHEVAVTADIVSSKGVKLLAKGARMSAEMRERLLEHKLTRPLEDCLEVQGVVSEAQVQAMAEDLLDEHAILRAATGALPGVAPLSLLGRLGLGAEMLSMLTVYAEHREGRLRHAVSVALLAKGLARRLRPGDVDLHRMLGRAGLMHDIGELYLDPGLWQPEAQLDIQQWRHVMTHPVVGHRVLLRMPGASVAEAEAVLCHHERLDGFGYPRSLDGERFGLEGQILALAEWLIGVLEAGTSAAVHARVASTLVLGEFNNDLLSLLLEAAASVPHAPAAAAPLQGLDRVHSLQIAMRRYRARAGLIQALVASDNEEMRKLLRPCRLRFERLLLAFSSAGLDAQAPQQLAEMLGPDEWAVRLEVEAMAREFDWRLRELERVVLLRSSALKPRDQAVVLDLVAALKDEGAPPA